MDHKTLKAKFDVDKFIPEDGDSRQQDDNLSKNNNEVPHTVKREEVHRVVEDSPQPSIC